MKLKLKIFGISLFLLISISAQELDPAFLASLPEEVRDDLLAQAEMKKVMESEQYRRPTTFIDKPETDSMRFGINIFSMMQTTLMPINEPNFDSNYVLDIGDVLQLQLVGQKSLIIDLTIKRDGSISVPEIGKIFIAGLSLSEAIDLVRNKIEISYIGVDTFLTLSKVRDIQIVVSGNAFNPGPYTINGNSNLFHALTVSGGPSEQGSFRKIDLIRDGEIVETTDLYEIFIFGKASFGKNLRSGDTVFIHPALNINGIYGGVKRSGEYELKDNETADDLIVFANGFTPDSDKKSIILEQLIDGIIIDSQLSYQNLEQYDLNDGENIYVRRFPIRSVTISGAVNNPGKYRINDGDGIKEIIERAGGYLSNAYPFGGILENEGALEANLYARDELYRGFLNTIIRNSRALQDSSLNTIGPLLTQLRESPVSGRVITQFDLDLIESDINLQDGDTIFIPEKINHLYVFGEVANQGSVSFNPNKRIDFYFESKGGLLEDADLENVFILYPNGISKRIKRKNLFRDGNDVIDIYPGSIIFVPRKAQNLFLTQSIQAYATILGNLGVSLASLSVIKD
tara:strand:+ start:1897 stop:3609 length:1713 start_codon:yes stop_codon:yes gene_type:complete